MSEYTRSTMGRRQKVSSWASLGAMAATMWFGSRAFSSRRRARSLSQLLKSGSRGSVLFSWRFSDEALSAIARYSYHPEASVSAATFRKLAKDTGDKAQELLHDWHDAFERGDCTVQQAGEIVDALLDLKIASDKIAPPSSKKQVKAT